MNALHHITPMGKFKWLLKREYWENRGGFLWAPLIAGGISLLLSLMAIIAGLFAANRAARNGDLHINGINVNGLDLGLLTAQMTPKDMAKWSEGIDFTLLLSSAWPFIVLAFVVFFYCLGALYDDRRDRSVLFWKSLPLSDTQTVLSKLASALVVAPVLAVIAAVLTLLGFALMISIVGMAYGGNPMTLVWGPANPLSIIGGMLAWIPVYALWALPTAGWLLLCSAWARSKPFLWAVMLPVFAGVIVSWFGLMKLFGMNAGWFWGNVVGRLLLGTVPGIELAYTARASDNTSLQSALQGFTASSQLSVLAEPQLWIGAAFGVVFIAAAIWLRQRRAGEI